MPACIIILITVLGTLLQAEEAEVRTRPTAWAQPVLGVKLENVFKVSDELYRSEQPDDDDLADLRRMGIRSVLNLREFHDDKGEIRDPGITLYRVAMDAGDMDLAKIEQAMRIIRDAPKPILVHCWHGSDRTGAVVAMYRMRFLRWERAAAIDEFKHGGFGYHEKWYPNIETFLRNVAIAP